VSPKSQSRHSTRIDASCTRRLTDRASAATDSADRQRYATEPRRQNATDSRSAQLSVGSCKWWNGLLPRLARHRCARVALRPGELRGRRSPTWSIRRSRWIWRSLCSRSRCRSALRRRLGAMQPHEDFTPARHRLELPRAYAPGVASWSCLAFRECWVQPSRANHGRQGRFHDPGRRSSMRSDASRFTLWGTPRSCARTGFAGASMSRREGAPLPGCSSSLTPPTLSPEAACSVAISASSKPCGGFLRVCRRSTALEHRSPSDSPLMFGECSLRGIEEVLPCVARLV